MPKTVSCPHRARRGDEVENQTRLCGSGERASHLNAEREPGRHAAARQTGRCEYSLPCPSPPPFPARPVRTIGRDVELRFVAPKLEKLTLAVERLHGSAVATRGAFLVLTQTLLLSLGDPDEAEPLRTCQRVYALLEPRLLEVVRNDGELVGPQKPAK